MSKKELREKILENVETVDCSIVKVYGVTIGVGYDLNARVTFKNGYVLPIKAHALRQSWACVGHLREYQGQFKVYTGSNDIYREQVIAYWENKDGLNEWLERLNKESHLVILKKSEE
jgi:hypothetical protein